MLDPHNPWGVSQGDPGRATWASVMLWIGRVATIVLGVRVTFLSVGYFAGFGDVRRYQVESAATAFVVVGALVCVAVRKAAGAERRTSGAFLLEWACWCGGALLLYWPSLHVGMLSDDFALADLASRGRFGPVHPELFRPLPLFAWGILLQLQGGAVALHVLNVVGHGIVSFLTSRLAAALAAPPTLARCAGLLVLVFPAAIEAVTWASGIFDVSSTLLLLAGALAGLRYGYRPLLRVRVAMCACAVGALLCKETGVVAPALIALVAWTVRRLPRRLSVDLSVLAAVFVVIGFVRLELAPSFARPPITRYLLQRWVFATVGGLAVPWHSQVAAAWPGLPITGALLVTVLAMAFLLTRNPAGHLRVAAASALWLLVGTMPAATFIGVMGDLQGSRFLYLSSVGYAVLLVTVSWQSGSAWRRVAAAIALGALVLLGVVGTIANQVPWLAAASCRDAVLAAAGSDARLRTCGVVRLTGLPDNVDGAYVFRNGAEFAFARAGFTLSDRADPGCVFRWDHIRKAFVADPLLGR